VPEKRIVTRKVVGIVIGVLLISILIFGLYMVFRTVPERQGKAEVYVESYTWEKKYDDGFGHRPPEGFAFAFVKITLVNFGDANGHVKVTFIFTPSRAGAERFYDVPGKLSSESGHYETFLEVLGCKEDDDGLTVEVVETPY